MKDLIGVVLSFSNRVRTNDRACRQSICEDNPICIDDDAIDVADDWTTLEDNNIIVDTTLLKHISMPKDTIVLAYTKISKDAGVMSDTNMF